MADRFDPFDVGAEGREFIESATVLAEPYREEITRLHTELRRTEGDLAVAVHEATTARRALRIVSAAHAVDHDALAAMTAALFDVAAPVQPEETNHG